MTNPQFRFQDLKVSQELGNTHGCQREERPAQLSFWQWVTWRSKQDEDPDSGSIFDIESEESREMLD